MVIYGLPSLTVPPTRRHQARPFDFLLDGQLLRGSLAKAIAARGLTGETTITLEYIELLAPPEPRNQSLHPDWVSSVIVCSAADAAAPLLSGCYDGSLYLWDSTGAQAAVLAPSGDEASPVKAVAWLGARPVGVCKDGTVSVWSTAGQRELLCLGHTAAVESVAASPAGDAIASGAWDKQLLLFRPQAGDAASGAAIVPPTKRARGVKGFPAATAAPPGEVEASAQLGGHSDVISSLCWSTAALLYSASWDGSVREWDASVGVQVATLCSSSKAVLSLDVSLGSATVATGHSDHVVRLWDARSRGGAPTGILPHKGWVSSVAWCGAREHLLISGCFDGGVRLWDTRSPKVALHELQRHERTLCVGWDGVDQVLSGGTDGVLRLAALSA